MKRVQAVMAKVQAAIARGQELLAQARKTAAAVAGVLGQVIALGVLHGDALHYTQIALAALTALAVYHVPNKTSA